MQPPRRVSGGRPAAASPRAPSSCTARSALRAPRSAPSPSTPACAARPSTATSPTRRPCSRPAARTGRRPTRPPTSAPGPRSTHPGARLAARPRRALRLLRAAPAPMLENLLRDEQTVPRSCESASAGSATTSRPRPTPCWPAGALRGRAAPAGAGGDRPRARLLHVAVARRRAGTRGDSEAARADVLPRRGRRRGLRPGAAHDAPRSRLAVRRASYGFAHGRH